MDKVVVITGPTASGKTSISIEVAKILGGEIINADSMQIYKMCDIGSAKVLDSEKQGIPHHLIDIVDPGDSFSTADFKAKAYLKIQKVINKGKVPVISGGTGLYIDAIIKNMSFDSCQSGGVYREQLNTLLQERGAEAVYGLLKERDPEAAKGVHMNNTRRVIRYLEILDGFEGTLSEYQSRAVSSPPEYDYRIFVLWPDRDFIYGRIEKRVDAMVESGLISEVRELIAAGVEEDSQSMMGIGYKETFGYLSGKTSREEFIELLKRNTRRYAKRQFTWMKRYKEAQFIPVDENTDLFEVSELIANLYINS